MKENEKSLTSKQKKELIGAAAAIMVAAVCLFLVLRSGAWLYDRGQWSDSEYFIGRINYTYEINNAVASTADSEINLVANVPIIGGVKINDTAQADTSDPNYQLYAEENFNEGVTVAHIVIRNKSDFDISGSYKLQFENLFSDAGNDIFYAVLPVGSTVDTKQKTVNGVTYKNYIKQIMNQKYSDFDTMAGSLRSYYAGHPELFEGEFSLDNIPDSPNNLIVVDILFWSEYNSSLPFVDDAGKLKPANPNAALTGDFSLSMELKQNS